MINPNQYRKREKPDVCDRCKAKKEITLRPYLFMENGLYENKWVCKDCEKFDDAFDEARKSGKYDRMGFPKELGLIWEYND